MEDQINNQIIDQICKEYDMIPWDSMAAALESSIEILSQENVEQSSEKTKGSIPSSNDVTEDITLTGNSDARFMRSNHISATRNKSKDQINCNEERNERLQTLRKRSYVCYNVGGPKRKSCQKSEPKAKRQKFNINAPNFNVTSSNVCEIIQIAYEKKHEYMMQKCIQTIVENKDVIGKEKLQKLPSSILCDIFFAQ
uniref:Uncharacterized protein n=1 Tax=Panagrolaimus sp. ES5 TaxID=591445 RepID=A0AC34FDS3_9BILA